MADVREKFSFRLNGQKCMVDSLATQKCMCDSLATQMAWVAKLSVGLLLILMLNFALILISSKRAESLVPYCAIAHGGPNSHTCILDIRPEGNFLPDVGNT